jgi:hypothetical protein
LEYTQHSYADIIICQRDLPQLGSSHVLHILRDVGAITPVVELLDQANPRNVYEANSEGFFDILRVPYFYHDIHRIVLNYLEMEKYISPTQFSHMVDAVHRAMKISSSLRDIGNSNERQQPSKRKGDFAPSAPFPLPKFKSSLAKHVSVFHEDMKKSAEVHTEKEIVFPQLTSALFLAEHALNNELNGSNKSIYGAMNEALARQAQSQTAGLDAIQSYASAYFRVNNLRHPSVPLQPLSTFANDELLIEKLIKSVGINFHAKKAKPKKDPKHELLIKKSTIKLHELTTATAGDNVTTSESSNYSSLMEDDDNRDQKRVRVANDRAMSLSDVLHGELAHQVTSSATVMPSSSSSRDHHHYPRHNSAATTTEDSLSDLDMHFFEGICKDFLYDDHY